MADRYTDDGEGFQEAVITCENMKQVSVDDITVNTQMTV